MPYQMYNLTVKNAVWIEVKVFTGKEVIFKEPFCFLKSFSQWLKMHYHAQVHQYLIFFFKKILFGINITKKKGFYAKGIKNHISSNVVGFADMCISTARARGGDLDDCISFWIPAPSFFHKQNLLLSAGRQSIKLCNSRGCSQVFGYSLGVCKRGGCRRISMLRRGSANLHVIPRTS